MGSQSTWAGAGVALLTVFDPATSQTTEANSSSLPTAAAGLADALHLEIDRLMKAHDVWGIEMLTREAATSSALACLGTAGPTWTGDYSTSWVSLLNMHEMITYAIVGELRHEDAATSNGVSPLLHARLELWDFILNHRIAGFEMQGPATRPELLGHRAAPEILAALQLYFAEVTEVVGKRVLLSVGPETVSTGSALTVFAHGHLGSHPSGYPAHGHREEDDHLIGSQVYARYRNTKATSATIHSHSRSQWRLLLRSYPPAYENSGLAGGNAPAAPIAMPIPSPSIPRELREPANTPTHAPQQTVFPGLTAEESRLLNLAHLHSGRPTGKIRITGFLRPSNYYQLHYALAEIVSGIVIPGSFLRRDIGTSITAMSPGAQP
ncbi:MAG: hypothetical protein ACR2IE_04910 [Candidatus Sumerlaeaceae bacterium]